MYVCGGEGECAVYSWSHIIMYAHLSIYTFLQYSVIHTKSTLADISLTKLQLYVHNKRYIDLFDTMKSQSTEEKKNTLDKRVTQS